MQLQLLRGKIHRATITHCELHYEGSCAIDENLLDAAGILEFEQVHLWNIQSGSRIITYAIRAERGSGMVSVNGSAARHSAVGDLLIIAAFGGFSPEEARLHRPQLVFVNEHNQIREERGSVPVQQSGS